MATVGKKKNDRVNEEDGFVTEMPEYLSGQTGKGRGSEDVSMNDMNIPRIEVIQAQSPQLDKTDTEFIDGSAPGMMFNTVTKKLFRGKLLFVPVYFRKDFLIWKDRKKGGGFAGSFTDQLSADKHRLTLEDSGSYEVVDTGQHFILILDGVRVEECVLSMARTKMKVSRQLNSFIRLAGGDRFSRVYELSTITEKNDQGSFFNYAVKSVGFPLADVFKKAETLYSMIRDGMVKVAQPAISDPSMTGSDPSEF